MDGRPNKSAHQELAEALASILHSGLVNLRGTAGHDRAYVRIEADHLHNLPFCIARPSLRELRGYYAIQRPSYLAAMKALGGRGKSLMPDYERPWSVIGRYLSDQSEDD